MASIEFELGDRKWSQSIPGSVAEYAAGVGHDHIIEAIRKAVSVLYDVDIFVGASGFGTIWAPVRVGEFKIRDD